LRYLPCRHLDPKKFAEKKQRRLHIGNLKYPQITVLNESGRPIGYPCLVYYEWTGKKRLSFPPDAKAFLYYFISPERPPISGELRFRLASSDDPESFERGTDLLMSDGRPWLRQLLLCLKSLYSPS
jgi:hypothetical protein